MIGKNDANKTNIHKYYNILENVQTLQLKVKRKMIYIGGFTTQQANDLEITFFLGV